MGIVARRLFFALMLGAVIAPALAKPPVTTGHELATMPARSDPDDLAADSTTLQPSVPRLAQKTAAARQPGPAAPAPNPDPVRAQKADNTVRITNMSGVIQRNYPLQLGRPFVCGEIAHSPQVIISGTPTLTQADVKNRCEDGSVKFAVIALVIPELPANGSLTLTFRDQATGNNQPLTTRQMLDERYNFDAQIQLTKPASISGSADPTLGNWKAITDGSLAIAVDNTTYQLTGLKFSSLVNTDYIGGILNTAAKAAKVPFSLYYLPGQGLVFGGKTISLQKPNTGTDIAPLLFKSNVVTTPGSDKAESASARQMLQNGICTPWTEGPVAQTMLCADDSVNRAYDLGFDSHRTLRPRFYVTFWKAAHQVAVRYVGEISNSRALAAFHYNLRLTLGNTNSRAVYTQSGIPHSIGTRWTREFWLNGAPEQKINIDHNIGYLAATYLVPNYDPTVKVPESAFNYANWQTADRSIGGAGFWQKSMATPGGRQDIGPLTAWTARWLYSGDWRAREIALTQGDLAGSWAMQVREGDPAKYADKNGTVPGLGKTVTRYGRPTSWGFDLRGAPNASDAFVILSPAGGRWSNDTYSGSGWSFDGAHQPDPFYAEYLLTGDYFYLEGLQLWAGYGSLLCSPGTTPFGCGPGARIYDQVRGQAWTLRNRVNAAVATPDSDPMKAIFIEMANDAFAFWEGQRDIRGTALEGTPMWKFGHSLLGTVGDGWGGNGIPPLHWWAGPGAYSTANPAYYNTDVALSADAHWMQNFLIVELGRAAELGLPAQALLAWAGSHLIGQVTDPGYNPYLVGQYVVPDRKKGPPPAYFKSWAEVLTAWAPEKRTTTEIAYWPAPVNYFIEARAAAALTARLPGGDKAWKAFASMIAEKTAATKQAINWGIDPTWAIIPRTR